MAREGFAAEDICSALRREGFIYLPLLLDL
jgi:hypothetical protein